MNSTHSPLRFLVRFADGTQIGPLDKQAIQTLVKNERLKPEDSLSLGDSGKWIPASRMKGLFSDQITSIAAGTRMFVRFANGKEVGPLQDTEVQARLMTGELKPTDELRLEHGVSWHKVGEVELFMAPPAQGSTGFLQFVFLIGLGVSSITLLLGAILFVVEENGDRAFFVKLVVVSAIVIVISGLCLRTICKVTSRNLSVAIIAAMLSVPLFGGALYVVGTLSDRVAHSHFGYSLLALHRKNH